MRQGLLEQARILEGVTDAVTALKSVIRHR
jgi:hypothetical protein